MGIISQETKLVQVYHAQAQQFGLLNVNFPGIQIQKHYLFIVPLVYWAPFYSCIGEKFKLLGESNKLTVMAGRGIVKFAFFYCQLH